MTTIREAQDEIIESFGFFDDWMDRYQYIIDLGKKLPEMSDADKSEQNKLVGCQSQVWIVADHAEDLINFRAISDSAIVCGLIALALSVYSGRTAQDILNTEPEFIKAIGLDSHLSPTRSNGLAAMMQWIKNKAQANL